MIERRLSAEAYTVLVLITYLYKFIYSNFATTILVNKVVHVCIADKMSHFL